MRIWTKTTSAQIKIPKFMVQNKKGSQCQWFTKQKTVGLESKILIWGSINADNTGNLLSVEQYLANRDFLLILMIKVCQYFSSFFNLNAFTSKALERAVNKEWSPTSILFLTNKKTWCSVVSLSDVGF